jgi:hypothetical protein
MTLKRLSALTVTTGQACAVWVASMGFHLWRIATLRPYFAGIADTGLSLGSFFTVFVLAAAARWYGIGDVGLERAACNILQSLGVIMLLSVRKRHSDSFFCALLGSSAIVDLLVCAMSLVGAIEEPRGNIFMVLEVCLYFNCYWAFNREPVEVRRSGYRRFGP